MGLNVLGAPRHTPALAIDAAARVRHTQKTRPKGTMTKRSHELVSWGRASDSIRADINDPKFF